MIQMIHFPFPGLTAPVTYNHPYGLVGVRPPRARKARGLLPDPIVKVT